MIRPLRVAFIAPYPASAVVPPDRIKPKYRDTEHPATWVRTLSEALVARRDTVLRVYVDSRAVTQPYEARINDVVYIFVPKREPIRSDPYHAYVPSVLRLRKRLLAFQPDVVVGFGTETGCGPIAVRLPFPSIVFVQGLIEATMQYRSIPRLTLRLQHRFELDTLRRAEAFVAETAFARAWVRGHVPDALADVIPHAVDVDYLGVRPDYAQERVLCVSSLSLIKGSDTVLRAFAACRNRSARLALAGTGALAAECEALARSLGIADRVEFLGHLDRAALLREMGRARVALLGSRMDTSPNAVTEAHAARLPVVATRAGGIPDMVAEGVDGLLAPVDDAAGLAAALDALLADPDRCRRMGEAGHEKVATLNDPARVAAQHRAFYQRVREQAAGERRIILSQPSGLRARIWVRRAIGSLPPGLRLGGSYRHWRRFLAEGQRWPRERIDAWQLERLKEIVAFAYEHTTGYRSLYQAAGFEPGDLRTIADFSRLPFVTKEMLQEDLEAFSVPGSRRAYASTGGSTGIPLGFYDPLDMRGRETAFMHDSWSWSGWKPGTRSAVLRGAFIGAPDRIGEYDPLHRELKLSSYYLTPGALPRYLEALDRHRIQVLQAYPSSLNILCDLLEEAGHARDARFRLILLGSENLDDWQLAKFRRIFPDARLFAWYGQAERVILAPWCESTTAYHVRPFYGMAELLDAKGREVSVGAEGELVGTNLHNRATPFIRYRTMDHAVKGESPCPACGRHFVILRQILGRSQEIIVTGGNRYVSMTAINMHDDIFSGLRQFQFLQEQKGRLVFKYVAKAALAPEALARIRTGLQAKLGDDVELELQDVKEIPRTAAGQYRFLDQRLPIRYGDR